MFAPCPSSPNCVSTESRDLRHAIAPFLLQPNDQDVWPQIRAAVLSLPRTRLISESKHQLHAECRSLLFSFADDLELQLRSGEGVIALRSAARKGYYDFGVNRRRLEKLRRLLKERGVLL